jgi:hypothetical protein
MHGSPSRMRERFEAASCSAGAVARDVDDRSGRADQADGQKTENLSDFAGLLRSGDCHSNLFHQGAAKESDNPDVIVAAMKKPGVVLRRPVGTDRPFREHAELPTDLSGGGPTKAARKSKGPKAKKSSSRSVDKVAERKAAFDYERERRSRERERASEEAARLKERERRQQAVDKAQAALETAERGHAKKAAAIQVEAEALEKKSQVEDTLWGKEKGRLEAALRRARG